MNLLDALKGIGKGAVNATGLPYFVQTDIINPIRENAAILSKNQIAYQNVNRDQNAQLQPGRFLANSASALTLPFALEGLASKFRPLVPPGPNYNFKMTTDTAGKLAEFGDHLMRIEDYAPGYRKFMPNAGDVNELGKVTHLVSKQSGIPFYNMAPRDAQSAIAKFLDEYQAIHGKFDF